MSWRSVLLVILVMITAVVSGPAFGVAAILILVLQATHFGALWHREEHRHHGH